ncbi:MAG: serine/threonine-protein kinase, partial [Anaerolineae bacterium]|nr:serine/threonine-protein kinase [Anaerolineae bacterium]
MNHPNIATIHEVLEGAEGVGYLVLEYVPGQTLAERIAKSKLKLPEALTIASQIAEAVAAAHEHGVIHRDLKPGNIKITPEGKVKVLDFGLAKAVGGEAADQHSTITEPGRVIGTPAYMSPEQARGQVTDKRSDIWSFGCVLYEMLTGQIPFKGETISDTLANILQTEPDWHALPQATSANIQVLVRRCLEKDPHRRLRDIGDAGIEISEALARPVSASVDSDPSRRALWKVAALCVFAGLIVGAIAMLVVMRGPIQPSEPRPVRRYSITLDPENPVALFRWGGYESPIFTPDGRQLIYATETAGDKWLVRRPWDSLDMQRIPGTQGACYLPQVSPDGRWLTFAAQRAIWKVPLAGGRPERIAENPMYDLPHVWEDENTLILGAQDGLSRFDLTTKELERLTTLDATPGYVLHFPAWLHRESGTLLFVASAAPTIDNCDLFTLSLETRKVRRLVEKSWRAKILSGRLIYSQKGRLMAAPFDARTLQIGPATNVTEDRMATDQT